ncbi:MAG TPA: hypothetical protein ENK22_03380 [Persephonella sp.]|nr:hypothetical protein [Persephonella sp.]
MKKFIFLIISVFIFSCSSVYNVQHSKIKKEDSFVVIPFKNNTETPLAGLRASSIVKGVLGSRGYNIRDIFTDIPERDLTDREIKSLLQESKNKGIRYAVVGDVNEWRYKTGIDGEPAVSLSMRIVDLETGKTVWVAAGSKSGWGHQSLGVVAQDLINDILDKVNKDK